MATAIKLALTLSLLLTVSACGVKGSLKLPEKQEQEDNDHTE